MILGWICHATNLHMAGVVDSREPQSLLEALVQMWFRPFHFFLEVWTDYDGGFRGVFSDYLVSQGISHRLVSPESNFQLGKIERHNWLLKGALVKLCDETAATT